MNQSLFCDLYELFLSRCDIGQEKLHWTDSTEMGNFT